MSWLSRRGKSSGPASGGARPAPRPPAALLEPRARVAPLSQQRLRTALNRHDWHYRINDEAICGASRLSPLICLPSRSALRSAA